jgi:hypothetical protein
MSHSFCGKGFFSFLFEKKEDRYLVFRSGPYFMGARGFYLNTWMPYFNLENDIPLEVSVWVCLPFLPLHCWNDDTLLAISNILGTYIDRAEPKDNRRACARIYVEVDLEKGPPEAIKLTLDNWTYLQELDYEKLPFKCKSCHKYGHFAKSFLKAPMEHPQEEHPEAWQ